MVKKQRSFFTRALFAAALFAAATAAIGVWGLRAARAASPPEPTPAEKNVLQTESDAAAQNASITAVRIVTQGALNPTLGMAAEQILWGGTRSGLLPLPGDHKDAASEQAVSRQNAREIPTLRSPVTPVKTTRMNRQN